jgi:hypothetical protein
MSRLCGLAFLLMLTSCAGAADMTAKGPAYQEGFGDGCATATSDLVPGQRVDHRNQALFQTDADYRAGWTSGFASCRMGPPRI